jgi:hypothetical protein
MKLSVYLTDATMEDAEELADKIASLIRPGPDDAVIGVIGIEPYEFPATPEEFINDRENDGTLALMMPGSVNDTEGVDDAGA